jgi:nicotinate-nucleotide adenylyltransferase
LAGIADIIIARRMSNAASAMPEFPYPHTVLNNEVMDISSEMIRDRIAAGSGKAWHYLVPQGARIIIEDRKLYRDNQHKEAGTGSADKEITGELIALVEEAARISLSAKRFIHSRNTALMARDLAQQYNLDANAAYLAGIAHDMAKKQSTDLEHGKDAAVLLQKRFNIHNKDVLEAIEVHTTGKPHMSDLAKVVFIADKIEFSRPADHGKFRDMAGGNGAKASSLDELFYAVLQANIIWLKEAGIKTSKKTLRLLEER